MGFYCELCCKTNRKKEAEGGQSVGIITNGQFEKILTEELATQGIRLPRNFEGRKRPRICADHVPKTYAMIKLGQNKILPDHAIQVGQVIEIGADPDQNGIYSSPQNGARAEEPLGSPQEGLNSDSEPDEDDECRNKMGVTPDTLFIVKYSKLEELLQICPCGQKRQVLVKTKAAALICDMNCLSCKKTSSWRNDDRMTDLPEDKAHELNWKVPIAMNTSAVPYRTFADACAAIDLKVPTVRSSTRVLSEVGIDAVTVEYNKSHERVRKIVTEMALKSGKGLYIATDASYDSPGYTAMICRLAIICVKTGLCLGVIIKHRKMDGNGNSGSLELLATQEAIQWAEKTYGLPVESLTTDRSKSVSKYMRDNHGPGSSKPILHKYDKWHVIKDINSRLRVAGKTKKNSALENWRDSIIREQYRIIEDCQGDAELVKERIWALLQHVKGVHEFSKLPEFKKIQCCKHETLPADARMPIDGNSAAFELLAGIFTPSLIEDLSRCDAVGATSELESFNNALLRHCPKRKWIGLEAHAEKMKLCMLEWNSRKFAELEGTRWVEKKRKVQMKFKKRISWKKVKKGDTESENRWRRSVFEHARLIRTETLLGRRKIRRSAKSLIWADEDVSSDDDEDRLFTILGDRYATDDEAEEQIDDRPGCSKDMEA